MNNGQPQQSKKVLIVAYHFPPDAAVGAMRPQKFVKYLPELGWQPYVLTIKERFIEKKDPGRLKDVENIEIVRTDFWRTPLQLLLDWRDHWRGAKKENIITDFSGTKKPESNSRPSPTIWRTLKHFIANFNWFPDDKLYWSIPAIWAGLRLIKREKITTIYTTAPPHSVTIIGLILSLLTGARLVVDFRDPWAMYHRSIFNAPGDHFFVFLESLCERFAIKHAKLIISTTSRLTDELRKQYINEQQSKFVTIPNGFDSDDIADISVNTASDGKFRICYIGTFYLERNPESFFYALQRVLTEGVISQDEIEVQLIGDVAIACGKPILEMVKFYGLNSCVKVLGAVPHREALQFMALADLLLLLAPNQEYQVPAKAFEYIGTQRPILALTGEGATADLIRTVNAGLVVAQDDVDGIYKALVSMYQQHQCNGRPWYGTCDITQYERKQLTRNLANLLNKINVITA